MGPAAAVRSVVDAKLAAILSSDGVKCSVRVVQGFIDSYSKNPKLNLLLHEPVLGGGNTDEQLPVKPLSDIAGSIHLLSGQAVGVFLSRLLPFTTAGVAPPTAERLVHSKLADVYKQLAKDATAMHAKLIAGSEAASTNAATEMQSESSVVPQLVIQHFAQVTFGRLDIAWQKVLQDAQQEPEEQQHIGSSRSSDTQGMTADCHAFFIGRPNTCTVGCLAEDTASSVAGGHNQAGQGASC